MKDFLKKIDKNILTPSSGFLSSAAFLLAVGSPVIGITNFLFPFMIGCALTYIEHKGKPEAKGEKEAGVFKAVNALFLERKIFTDESDKRSFAKRLLFNALFGALPHFRFFQITSWLSKVPYVGAAPKETLKFVSRNFLSSCSFTTKALILSSVQCVSKKATDLIFSRYFFGRVVKEKLFDGDSPDKISRSKH